MKRILIDNDCIDTIVTNAASYENLKDEIEFCVCSSVVEELASIPDSAKEQRIKVFLALSKIEAKFLTDAIAVIGYSRLDMARLPNEIAVEAYQALLTETRTNQRDAIIGATAAAEGCTLLTNDRRLANKMRSLDLPVLSFDEFCQKYNGGDSDQH